MLLTCLLIAVAAAEWVEISQRHLDTLSKDSHQTKVGAGAGKLKPYNKLNDNIKVKPNRYYINHSISEHHWDDENFKIGEKLAFDNSASKLAAGRHPSEGFRESNKNQDITRPENRNKFPALSEETTAPKDESKANGNKIVTLPKDSKPKESHRDQRPNRIYLGDEDFSGSLEVFNLSDLDKLAEQDSEQQFQRHHRPEPPPPRIKLEHKPLAATLQEQPKIFIENSTHSMKRTDITKKIQTELSAAKIDTALEKPVIIKKHMIAKITKVDSPNKIRVSTEKTEIIEVQKYNLTKSLNKNSSINTENMASKANIEDATPVKSITTLKPVIVKKNRYENNGAAKGETVPDPEEIMIQELLGENKESPDVVVKDGQNENMSENRTENRKTNEDKKREKQKDTRVPDPDNVMLQEILSERTNTSTSKNPLLPPHSVTVHRLKTHTENMKIKPTEKPHSNQNSAKELPSQTAPQEKTNVSRITNKLINVPPIADKKKEGLVSTAPVPNPLLTKLPVNDSIDFDRQESEDFEENSETLSVLTTIIKPYTTTTTTTEENIKSGDSGGEMYKPMTWLHEPKPKFVSKEDFFTESEELVELSVKDKMPGATLFDEANRSTQSPPKQTVAQPSDQTPTTPQPDEKSSSEKNQEQTVDLKDGKDNTMDSVVKLLKVVTDIISRNTRRSFSSKVRYLEELKETLLANIEERLEATFPSGGAQAGVVGRRARSAQVRGHVDFPSSESALMTISFLTFAVFLIKLVLQVIHTYKGKATVPAVVAAVGRAWRGRTSTSTSSSSSTGR